jgi:glutamate dehydrogenase (NAD(P)+)
MGIPEPLRSILRQPKQELTVSVPIRRDDGSVQVYTGHRVQHSVACGPAKGGIRCHPGVALDEVRALAMWMTWKCAVLGLPYGGAEGGINVDPKDLSLAELERLTRRFAAEIAPVAGEPEDLLEPDVSTTLAVRVTGKPVSTGGSRGREPSAARGCVITGVRAAKRLGIDPTKARFVVHGFGDTGSHAAESLAGMGARCIAASDSKGAVFSDKGLDVAALIGHKQARSTVVGFAEAEAIDPGELFLLPVEVLIPAGAGGVIDEAIARRIPARLIVEAADGPTLPEADDVLYARGVSVIPDVLANAGAVTVSHLEGDRGPLCPDSPAEEVNSKLRAFMETAFDAVWKLHEDEKCDLRTAAYMRAIARVAEAEAAQGLAP